MWFTVIPIVCETSDEGFTEEPQTQKSNPPSQKNDAALHLSNVCCQWKFGEV